MLHLFLFFFFDGRRGGGVPHLKIFIIAQNGSSDVAYKAAYLCCETVT